MYDHVMEVDEERSPSCVILKFPQESYSIDPCVFNEEKLPTDMDVLKRILLAYDDKLGDANKSLQLESFVPDVTNELVAIWKKTHIPIISQNGIQLKMNRLITKYRKQRNHKKQFGYKQFIKECEELFDIARCKCTNGCCECIETDKIPKEFVDFMSDQRNGRNLRLTEFDSDVFVPLSSALLFSNESEPLTSSNQEMTTSASEYIPTLSSVENFLDEAPRNSYNSRTPMPNLATECDRYGVSDRLAAALVSAAFKDYGVKESGQLVIIDKNKIERERVANRKNMLEKRKCTGSIIAFSFDGRSDETVVQHRTTDGKMHPRKIKEKHITVLKQPNSQYLGYAVDAPDETSRKRPAQLTAEYLLDFFQRQQRDLSNLVAVSSDGEVKNTGRLDGILRTLEKSLETPLHWFVCLIHFIELCLRHIFEKIDKSRTTGPRTGTGTIRKAIEAMQTMEGVDMPVTEFHPIPFTSYELPPNIEKFKLSTDEKLLYDLAMAVSTGQCSESLANKKVPPLHEARWLTKACRVLRLYITKEFPSKNLTDLTTFIMHVYVPTYFNVKHRCSCTRGSFHFFNVIKYSRYLPSPLFATIKETCENNPYFAHSENLLLAMIYDRNPEIRKLGYQKILHSRETDDPIEQDSKNVRENVHPKILFDCETYYSMIDWDVGFTEPPFTRNITYDELTTLAENGTIIDNEITKVSCHNQANERHVKLVTEVAVTLEGREQRAKFDSKQDFI